MLLDEKILILPPNFLYIQSQEKFQLYSFYLKWQILKLIRKITPPQIRKNTEVELLQKKTLDESRRGETNMADEQRAVQYKGNWRKRFTAVGWELGFNQ